jgi:hypothetical protein
MQTRNDFPDKNEFPAELQQFYLENRKQIHEFNGDFSLLCLLIEDEEIRNENGIFLNYKGRRPDQIHYSTGIGFIEEKTTNYAKSDIEYQFSEFKRYFDGKYSGTKVCTVKYFILYAPTLSDKLKRELKVNKDNNSLVYSHKRNKQYKINNIPVYFMKKNR